MFSVSFRNRAFPQLRGQHVSIVEGEMEFGDGLERATQSAILRVSDRKAQALTHDVRIKLPIYLATKSSIPMISLDVLGDAHCRIEALI